MLIGIDKRFVFVASTKTASTSVERALRPHADIVRAGSAQRKHIGLNEILGAYEFLFSRPDCGPEHFFKFSVMRDPLDWIRSWYRYRLGNKVESPLPEGMSFAEFWSLKDWNIQRADGSKHLQGELFKGPDGEILADVIIPYDRLEEMYQDICRALEVPDALPRANVSRITTADPLPPDLEEEVRAFYQDDYALFAQLDAINAEGMARLREGRSGFRTTKTLTGPRGVAAQAVPSPNQHVFVFSYCVEAGTFVQTLLNGLPGYCIRGENNDAALHLMRSRNAITVDPQMTALRSAGQPTPVSDPLYGAEQIFPREYGNALAGAFTRAVLKPETTTQCAGFRSSFMSSDAGVMRRYANFLLDTFQNARILFVTRRHSDARPRPVPHTAERRDEPEFLKNMDAFYEAFRNTRPDCCHIVEYDQLSAMADSDQQLAYLTGKDMETPAS